MRIRIPSRRVYERFYLIYELKGCQESVDFFAKYYRVRRMRITLDVRFTRKNVEACYERNKAFFSKKGMNKRTGLHEFYHHLVESKKLTMPLGLEERRANRYARTVLKRRFA